MAVLPARDRPRAHHGRIARRTPLAHRARTEGERRGRRQPLRQSHSVQQQRRPGEISPHHRGRP